MPDFFPMPYQTKPCPTGELGCGGRGCVGGRSRSRSRGPGGRRRCVRQRLRRRIRDGLRRLVGRGRGQQHRRGGRARAARQGTRASHTHGTQTAQMRTEFPGVDVLGSSLAVTFHFDCFFCLSFLLLLNRRGPDWGERGDRPSVGGDTPTAESGSKHRASLVPHPRTVSIYGHCEPRAWLGIYRCRESERGGWDTIEG